MTMIKQHKKMIILTSIVTLLPILIGLLLWNKLPDSLATHFNLDNQPNGYSSKAFAVLGLPFFLFAIHLICIIATSMDPKAKSINPKIFRITLCICPLISIWVCCTMYAYSLGYLLNINLLSGVIMGIFYVILGNFIPTVKPNYTIGFRIPWALNDSDNWYHTHRFAGKCLVISGILMIVTSPFQNLWVVLVLVLVPCVLTVAYSYLYYRKKIS